VDFQRALRSIVDKNAQHCAHAQLRINDQLASSASLNKFDNMEHITDTQCRMARGALNWSTRDLAKASHVGATTIARFESGKPANPSTLALLKQALEAAGLVFIADGEESARGGPGVRLKVADANA
jgi:DNA-binding transcriptional regulator YiaG